MVGYPTYLDEIAHEFEILPLFLREHVILTNSKRLLLTTYVHVKSDDANGIADGNTCNESYKKTGHRILKHLIPLVRLSEVHSIP
jgi:hypothetical protein